MQHLILVGAKLSLLKFMDRLPKLKEFAFVDVQLDDGDLSPVLRIEEVRFDNKRHYSQKPGGPVGRLIR